MRCKLSSFLVLSGQTFQALSKGTYLLSVQLTGGAPDLAATSIVRTPFTTPVPRQQHLPVSRRAHVLRRARCVVALVGGARKIAQ